MPSRVEPMRLSRPIRSHDEFVGVYDQPQGDSEIGRPVKINCTSKIGTIMEESKCEGEGLFIRFWWFYVSSLW